VVKIERWWSILKPLLAWQLTVALVLGTVGCRDRVVASEGDGSGSTPAAPPEVVISEVSPPEPLQELRQALEVYHPQVTIASPQTDEILEDETIAVRLQVRDLPVFQNETFGLGPHLEVILDNRPSIPVYDPDEPLIFSELSPGTHTLRVFAVRPWGESFKNEGAYAQTTFHLYTKTDDNAPESDVPLLTYNQPQGNYGAEPILLDFYLTDAPLHLIAQESEEDNIVDWRIRCTIDGKSFVIDRWQPIYLTGFRPGKNWVKLEFLDELGNPVKNVFNNTVRVITYEPGGDDPLSQLIRGDLSVEEVRGIVDPNYVYEPETEEPISAPVPEIPAEPETLPEIPTESETLPEIPTEPETLPEVLEESEVPAEPETLPEIPEEVETLPEIPAEPGTLPEILEEPTSILDDSSDDMQIPEEVLEPTVEPEIAPEPSEEDGSPAAEMEIETESDEPSLDLVVPEDSESVLEITPGDGEELLLEEEVPIESSQELETIDSEKVNSEEILPETEVEEVPEAIDLESEVDSPVEETVDSEDSAGELLEEIKTGDIELTLEEEEMATEAEPEMEKVDLGS